MLKDTNAGVTYNVAIESAAIECSMIAPESKTKQRLRMDRFLASVQGAGYRMAYLSTSSRDDALELVQEAMLQLVKRYADKPDNELKVLFYRILSSKITDWYRKTAFRSRYHAFFSKESYELGDPVQQLGGDVQLPYSESLNNSRMLESLTLAVKNLSLRQQQTFLLRAWQGFNIKETASIMGCSTGTVKTHYSRALGLLRNELGDYNE